MTDRLAEQGAVLYAQNNPTSAGISRLGAAGRLQAAIADALSNGRSSLSASRLGAAGRIYALAANAGPLFLFQASEVGVWYDPSDLSSMWQDAAGTTAAVVGQPVGLMLDKSQGMQLGSERLGDLTILQPRNANSSLVSETSSQIVVDSAAAGTYGVNAPTVTGVVGTSYWINITLLSSVTRVFTVAIGAGAKNITLSAGVPSTQLFLVTSTATTALDVYAAAGAAGERLTVTALSVKSIAGYHATQATSTARPIIGRHPITGRRNLVSSSVPASNANLTATLSGLDVSGSYPAYNLVPAATSAAEHTVGWTISSVGAGVPYIQTVEAKANGYDRVGLWNQFTGVSAVFDLLNGSVLSGGAAAVITSLGNGWYRCSLAYTQPTSATTATRVYVVEPGSTVVGAWVSTPDGVSGILVSKYQPELGSTPTAYQKVVSTYDVTEAGVNDAYYLDDDGVDDAAAQADGGGGSTGFFLCAAVRPDGGAGAVRTIWSDAGTNTGYIVRLNASNQLEIAAGNGTAYTLAATTGTLSVGTTYVVTAWDDGTNLNVQVNSGTAGTAARPVVSAGNADFRIGKDYGAATGFFNGAIYSLVYVKNGQNVDATDRATVKAYIASKAGVTL